MPEKTTPDGRKYDIDGKAILWHPEDDDGVQGNKPDIRVPLRLKMGLVLKMAEREMDNTVMAEMITAIIPNQSEAIADMDVNDFQDMFTTWQREYNTVSGASLGEPSGSGA